MQLELSKRRPMNDSEQAVPEKWLDALNERCDLDQSFQALQGWDHFHTDTIRGRLRSFQLKPREAWDHFDLAVERAEGSAADRKIENACVSIPTLINTSNMGLSSAIVHAFLMLLDRNQEAGEWADFLKRLQIPPKTIEIFRERSRRIVERSSYLQR